METKQLYINIHLHLKRFVSIIFEIIAHNRSLKKIDDCLAKEKKFCMPPVYHRNMAKLN